MWRLRPGRWFFGALLLAVVLLVVVVLPGAAFESVRLKLGTLEGAGWSAREVTLQLSLLDESHVAVLLQADSAVLPDAMGSLTDLSLSCAGAVVTTVQLECADGRLKAQSVEFGPQHIKTAFSYRLTDGRIDTRLQGIHVLGGELAITAVVEDAGWQLAANGSALSLEALSRHLAAAGYGVPVLKGDGRLALTASLRGAGSQLARASLGLTLQADEFSDAEGSLAGENLEVSLDALVKPVTAGWQVALEVTGRQGGLYVDPVFVEMPAQPIRATARLDWLARDRQLLLHAFNYHHPGSVQLDGSGRFRLAAEPRIQEMLIDIQQADFPSLYESYLQPWLNTTALGELETAGQIAGQLHWHQGVLNRVRLDLVDLSLDDAQQRFELNKINGRLRWSDSAKPVNSELEWDSGSVFRVALGPTRLTLASGHNFVGLLKPAQIPVLDGMLEIAEFELEYGDSAPLRWQVDGFLTPVSLPRLSQALGWPALAGKLSGVIPDVSYDDGSLEVGGVLLMRVFEGEVTLRKLKLENPFGLVPRLQVDARAVNIDLETLTRTFSFGKIEGRLEGRIDGLHMESWRPVAFDAEFLTPVNDKSRHRISQKAVDNISSIGGSGVGGALSRSFLRFFEDFPYQRLGIRCRLLNGICQMSGVEPAADGYYLVKGRLLPPRLDVIGYADRVNWETLVAQIMAVTGQQDVIVE
jgi:hypothetical protein